LYPQIIGFNVRPLWDAAIPLESFMGEQLVTSFRGYLQNATDEMTRLSQNCTDTDGRSCTEAGGKCVTDLDRDNNGTYVFWCRKEARSIAPAPLYEDSYEFNVYLISLHNNNDDDMDGVFTRIYPWPHPGVPANAKTYYAKVDYGRALKPYTISQLGDSPVRYRIDQMMDHDNCQDCNLNWATRCHEVSDCDGCARKSSSCSYSRKARPEHNVGLSVVVCPQSTIYTNSTRNPCYRIFWKVNTKIKCSTGARALYSLSMYFDRRSRVPLNVTLIDGYERWIDILPEDRENPFYFYSDGGPSTLDPTKYNWTYTRDELQEDLDHPDTVFEERVADWGGKVWEIRDRKNLAPTPVPTHAPSLAPTPSPSAFRGIVSDRKGIRGLSRLSTYRFDYLA
jgi:hypothetical protein